MHLIGNKPWALYNEIDTFAAAWLRELIKAGHIAPGEVDTRSIADVMPSDLAGFTQCHFFAGIGVWSYALRQAGWPDDRPVWTGSTPCQPFSSAGKGKGFKDERHLWPAWYSLIRKCRPAVIFGEQVAASAGSHLQRVPNGATNLRFPSEGERRLEMGVQEVLCHEEVEESLSGESLRLEVQKGAQGERFNPPCEVTGREKGCSFQSRHVCGRDTAKDRLGFLRSNGPTVQSRQREDLGQPFFGQDNTGRRICLLQHADCMPCCQQCYGRLGGAKDSGYGEWHFGKKKREVEQSFEKARRMLEEEDASTWLQLIQNDLGRSDYTVGSCIAPAAGFGAPHIRQRLYWVGHTESGRSWPGLCDRRSTAKRGDFVTDYGCSLRVEHTCSQGLQVCQCVAVDSTSRRNEGGTTQQSSRTSCRLDNPKCNGWGARRDYVRGHVGQQFDAAGDTCGPGPVNGLWRDADWLLCRDGKWRPVEPAFKQMADGIACGMGYLCDCRDAVEKEEVVNDAATDPYTGEVLRKMWETPSPETVWLQTGRQIGFYEASLLLTCVLKYTGKLGQFIDSVAQGSAENGKRILRNMWEEWSTTSPSQRFECGEQSPDKLTNTLRKLPQEDSLELLKTLNGSPLACKAPGRVGRLRGYGNAINAEQAKAFIEAFMEVNR